MHVAQLTCKSLAKRITKLQVCQCRVCSSICRERHRAGKTKYTGSKLQMAFSVRKALRIYLYKVSVKANVE